jgi:ethanolamine permease
MAELNRSITPLMLWAMGVGCAFAGLFFGWNLGLARGGTLGLGLALVLSLMTFLAILISHRTLGCLYLALMGVSFVIHRRTASLTAAL